MSRKYAKEQRRKERPAPEFTNHPRQGRPTSFSSVEAGLPVAEAFHRAEAANTLFALAETR
ncbi:MAG TPA: hypothetical protein VJ124_06485 [Pyrinomonadaceae bacterium]|nr:hypothetical protein [Pyrinomonadaceae bacterium]